MRYAIDVGEYDICDWGWWIWYIYGFEGVFIVDEQMCYLVVLIVYHGIWAKDFSTVDALFSI